MSLLPIGSVVSISDNNTLVMIYGHLQKNLLTGEIFDYIGCHYPEGILDTDQCLLFNEKDICKLYFVGLQDTEELAYQVSLEEFINRSSQLE